MSDSYSLYKFWLNQGWKVRCEQRPELKLRKKEYSNRINMESKILRDKDFIDYFLVISDLCRKAKARNIAVGPARGSVAASLVAYILQITEVDPLHPAFDRMLFERFIDPSRADMPDADLDFDDERRNEVAEIAREIYGDENVANVGNHIKYRGKKALQDVARAYGLGQRTFDPIGNRCVIRTETDERVDDSIQDVIESYSSDPSVGSLVDSHGIKLQQAIQLEGNQHSMGIHAGGFVISSDPIPDVCAIISKDKAGGEAAQVIPYDKRDAEYLNMLKMDFLGLSTMGMLSSCLEWIGRDLTWLYSLFYKTWELDQKGRGPYQSIMDGFINDDLVGIFQFEGGTTRQLCRKVKPETFDHLAAINALSRPGPYYGGQADAYVKVKNGEEDWVRVHPAFDQHVEWTYGQIVYQEQIMYILRDLAGFDIAKVLRVRKIIGKKLGEHQFAALWNDFREGCANNNVGGEQALRVWNSITTAAGYAFCVTGDTILEKGGAGGNDPSKFVTIKELYERQESKSPIGKKIRQGRLHLLGMDDDGRIRPQTLIKVCPPVVAKVIKFIVESGRSITVSTKHKFLTQRGYILADQLTLNDFIMMDCGEGHRNKERIKDGMRYDGYYRGMWNHSAKVVYERAKGRCEDCGEEDDGQPHTLEFSHVLNLEAANGDYDLYHSEYNMRLLCNSCHKKFDYRFQKTRVKRWQKGRQTKLEAITSIENAGFQEVYDLQIKEDAHNYIGNGFVNHNNIAHAYSYSLIGWWSMFLKQSYPAIFYAASLAKNGDGKDDIPRRTLLLQDARIKQIKILPPKVGTSSVTWRPGNTPITLFELPPQEIHTIHAGLSQIPGVGASVANSIIDWRKEYYQTGGLELPDWWHLVEVKGIGEKTILKMMEFSESFDPFGIDLVARQLGAFRKQFADGEFPDGILPEIDTFRFSYDMPDRGMASFCGVIKNIVYTDEVERIREKTGKSFDQIKAELKDPDKTKKATIFAQDEFGEVALRVSRWAYPEMSELIAAIDPDKHMVVAWGMSYEAGSGSLQCKQLWVLDLD